MGQYIGLGPNPGYSFHFLHLFFSVLVLDLEHFPFYAVSQYELLIWCMIGLCLLTFLV